MRYNIKKVNFVCIGASVHEAPVFYVTKQRRVRQYYDSSITMPSYVFSLSNLHIILLATASTAFFTKNDRAISFKALIKIYSGGKNNSKNN